MTVRVMAATSGRPVRRRAPRTMAANLLPQWSQLQLGLRDLVAVPPALGDVHVDRDLGQAARGHQPFEQTRPPAEGVAVGHHHGDDADRARVAEDFDQLLHRTERHLAVGDLDVALGTEEAAQLGELPQDGRGRQGRDVIGLTAELAPRTGEVAAGLNADHGAAADGLLTQALPRKAKGGVEPHPAFH